MQKFETKEEGILYFKNLGYEIKEGPDWFIVVPKQEEIKQAENKSRYKSSFTKKCKICNIEFNYGQRTQKTCSCCKIFLKCSGCDFYFEKIKVSLDIIEKIYNYKNIIVFCCLQEQAKYAVRKSHENRHLLWQDPEWVERVGLPSILNAGEKSREPLKNLWENDTEWAEMMKNILTNNVKIAQEKLEWLRENDPKWVESQRESCSKNMEIARQVHLSLWQNPEWVEKVGLPQILEASQNSMKLKLQEIKDQLSNLSLVITESSIDVNNIQELRKNDICGSYIIKAKFKDYQGTEKENEIFDILACKSKYVYDEIYWVLRVLSQPEKQDKVISEANPWTLAKWWYISNLYYDFEFVLLTDSNGISEEEALLIEAKYAIENNLFVEFLEDENCNRIPNVDKHAYWSL